MKTSKKTSVRIPKILTIAGSDSGGGAGLQADLKVITALGGYGMTVVTAITAQNTLGVTKIQGIDLDVIDAQIDAVVSDIGVDAVKIGMLSSPEIVHCVAAALRRHAIKTIVLDPVLRATSGASLGGDATARAMREALFPLATVITPNMEEASILLGRPISEPTDFEQAARDLIEMGPDAVLIKGGHLDAKHTQLMDFLMWRAIDEDGKKILEQKKLLHYRVNTPNTHGTGCSLASAIATYLADGHDLSHAVAKGIAYVEAGLEAGAYLSIGQGSGPLWHMHAFYPTVLPDDIDPAIA
ncbi:bifunctional hydroxymethylpyrimidine kinase/phosphomethylpyrimidine kinase [Polynucleobacter difficilis]|uniref:bifunctional hydroxymethylpyrimidine kinase/phosphomethylpyrimidine kinase n=1 Tax=Polynucleobacter difficilis TaxID=556054 RepID=UPI000D351970|nr:bifunctional hydroxymethylpyrimidine kinase/phosphomethylpyrimidine kinase [Polynucleobacter difficilis]